MVSIFRFGGLREGSGNWKRKLELLEELFDRSYGFGWRIIVSVNYSLVRRERGYSILIVFSFFFYFVLGFFIGRKF